MKDFFGELRILFGFPRNIVMLSVRLVLAYGFSQPAILKMNNLNETVKWFRDLTIPFPDFTVYLVIGFESLGIVLLVLGLFTRYISIALSCVMIGAIYFVHWPNGFSVANNGIEIPLYYFIFLIFLATHGGGKFSLDRLIFEKGEENE